MTTAIVSLPRSSSRFSRALLLAAAIVTPSLGCDDDHGAVRDEAAIVDDAADFSHESPADVELAAELLARPDAAALRTFLEGQGYRADFDGVGRSETDPGMANLVLTFAGPTSASRDAAIVFHVAEGGDLRSVAATTIDRDGAQRLYVVDDGEVRDPADLPAPTDLQAANPTASCDWWVPYGCGECRNTSLLCAYKNRPGYFWGIKWGTCGTCSATNENGCC
jgi:hypothetical protein